MSDDLTLLEKIQREQAETYADLQRFIESERQTTAEDIEAMQIKQAEISELIQEIAEKSR